MALFRVAQLQLARGPREQREPANRERALGGREGHQEQIDAARIENRRRGHRLGTRARESQIHLSPIGGVGFPLEQFPALEALHLRCKRRRAHPEMPGKAAGAHGLVFVEMAEEHDVAIRQALRVAAGAGVLEVAGKINLRVVAEHVSGQGANHAHSLPDENFFVKMKGLPPAAHHGREGFAFASGRPVALREVMPSPTDTIAAPATPTGVAAIALIRATGTRIAALTQEIFGATPLPRLATHADYRDRTGALVDDVLFTYFAGPHSFTGEDTLEISCHGNPFIAQKILEDLLARGCRPAEAGEFSKRAFLNGRMDLSQAEAIMDLIHARSEKALAAANQQLRGALGRQMEGLIRQLVNILAMVEAYVDFPEEDLPPEDRRALERQLDQLLRDAQRLIATNRYGALLREGIKTVIVGEPNAGKSSLLNRLVGRDRALVSPEPGTTRDYLEERVTMGPHWLRLIDTAGLNPSASSLEKRGIEKTFEQAEVADLFLWVIDSTRPVPALPAALAKRMVPENTIAVFNKIDLPPAREAALPSPFPTVNLSALNGAGVEALQAVVTKLAEAFHVETGSELIAINARHAHALGQARASLESARQKLSRNEPGELLASDLREALAAFGEVSGKVDNERILDQLFASFCIGK